MSPPAADYRQWHALALRVETAIAGNRTLDADFMEAIGYQVRREPRFNLGRSSDIAWRYLVDGRWQALPHVSSSLGTAIRWKGCGCYWSGGEVDHDNAPWATITLDHTPFTDFTGKGANLTLSTLAAICRKRAASQLGVAA